MPHGRRQRKLLRQLKSQGHVDAPIGADEATFWRAAGALVTAGLACYADGGISIACYRPNRHDAIASAVYRCLTSWQNHAGKVVTAKTLARAIGVTVDEMTGVLRTMYDEGVVTVLAGHGYVLLVETSSDVIPIVR